ncbi:valyl-tRNA synthetase [Lysinibacillus sp. NPDC094403]|uniref:valyl-tRNA synthetase n=1 Tax=Lysinibacillus sp. NPDC094403 TaxID=3390581 RepID=UPI003D02263B
MQLEDSLRLMGIYHITAHVRFDFQDMKAFMGDEELVQIEALDLQGDTGYFEYAVPLNVDLPKDAAIEDLMVKDIRPILTNQMCQLEWTVTSIFNESEPAFEKAHALEKQPVTVNASALIDATSQVKQPTTVVDSIQEEKIAVVASAQEKKSTIVTTSIQEEKSKAATFSAHKEKSETVLASDKKEKPAPAEQKIVLRESSSHIVVRESSSWHEVPSMIWDLTEDYTPLKVRVSNDLIQK